MRRRRQRVEKRSKQEAGHAGRVPPETGEPTAPEMSEVLLDLAEPLLAELTEQTGLDLRRTTLLVASAVWNTLVGLGDPEASAAEVRDSPCSRLRGPRPRLA